MEAADWLPLNLEPGSLAIGARRYEAVEEVYRRHQEFLLPFLREMVRCRRQMLDQAFTADFGDREGELLYLLVRETRPSVVVEISPCCGYSTNYILAALTHNGHGRLFSYELAESAQGRPIRDVIHANLASSLDQRRLELVIGDATAAPIPEHDFLFVDSNHEAWFSAWYFSELVSRPRTVFVHDVLIHPAEADGLLPKAPFLGVREQYYVLQALHENHQRVFCVADFDEAMAAARRASLPVRYGPGNLERSIVFSGHAQCDRARAIHKAMRQIHEARLQAVVGDRVAAVNTYEACMAADLPLFAKLLASSLLPLLGYRVTTHPDMFRVVDVNYAALTVSEWVALLEFALAAASGALLRESLRALRDASIAPHVAASLDRVYRAMLSDLRERRSRFGRLRERVSPLWRGGRRARAIAD